MASRPPAIRGFKVFRRPPKISGKPVSSETSRTAMPFEAKSRDVPPVEMISTLRSASVRANSTMPVLSYTLISARSIRPTPSSELLQVAVHCFPDMKPDICHIGDGVRVRDGGNPKLGRRFDYTVEIGQF